MYYHGTDNGSAEIIVKTQQMCPSIGEHQWLGDGCYFYCDKEYAFRWILIKYTENFKNKFTEDYSRIFDKYAIICAEININSNRLFSMDNIQHSMLFNKAKEELITNTVKKSIKYKKHKVIDGIVFNFLFNKMNYKESYDAVKAVFPISHICNDSRLEFLPEPQICVKNLSIISNIQKYSEKVVPEEYITFIIDYNSLKNKLKKKKHSEKYTKKNPSVKYKI